MFKWLTYKTFLSAWVCAAVPLISFNYLKNNNGKVVLGNYQSYIDPNLLVEGGKKFNMKFDSFENDKKVGDNFKNNIYDAAIVSNATHQELIKKELVKRIDWSRFSLKKTSGDTAITTNQDAKDLFSDSFGKIIKDNEALKYGIPYFLSSFSFYYRGNEIEELKAEQDWDEIVKVIFKEDRFKSKNGKPQLAIIDDPRTVLSFSKLLKKKEDININEDLDRSLSKMQDAFSVWGELGLNTTALGENPILLNSDSNVLLDMLSKKKIMGAFIYSGDALFSLQGGNEKTTIPANDFHESTASKKIYIMDFLTISKKISSIKEDQLYKFINKLFFEGHETEDMLLKEKDEYKYGPAQNFDYLNYTPVLKKLFCKLKTEKEGDTSNTDSYKELKNKILLNEISDENKILYEKDLDDISSTNMIVAYEQWKSNL